jgi:hypothetical protein
LSRQHERPIQATEPVIAISQFAPTACRLRRDNFHAPERVTPLDMGTAAGLFPNPASMLRTSACVRINQTHEALGPAPSTANALSAAGTPTLPATVTEPSSACATLRPLSDAGQRLSPMPGKFRLQSLGNCVPGAGLALALLAVGVLPAHAAPEVNAAASLADAADLKFRDFFALPVGPKGLVPSQRLLSLAGQRVRVVGYMARQDQPSAGIVIVAPLPVVLGGEDESFSDDLPASVLYVHLADADRERTVPWAPGLHSFTGVLQLGAASESDGRLSFVRLQLDPEPSRALLAAH